MKKALVLGCGLVGKTIAEDLSKEYKVKVLDTNEENLSKLNQGIERIRGSALDISLLSELVKDADIICGALPGSIGYEVAKNVLSLGKKYCDISFMPEDFLKLDEIAKEKKTTAVFDMGVAPGISNLLVGRGAHLLEKISEVKIYVGGLPENPVPPFNYKAVFSPYDVLEEYTRPARYIRDGKLIEEEALSGLEYF
ncbi:MAG: saccharopine dehydrogenase NADP-binding domain-containing protein [Synergistetes bacterium]|nr:saccharopine dehydrogenase NADP-binding domain-containing protein [Synergistota bacterium]